MEALALRVLHVFKTYWPEMGGGVERMIDSLARSGENCGVRADILCLGKRTENLEHDGQHIYKVRQTAEFASTGLAVGLPKYLLRHAQKADLVHYHFPWPMMDVAHLMARHGRPSIVTYHSDVVRQKRLMTLYRPLMRRFLNHMDCVVPTSEAYLNSSVELKSVTAPKNVIEIGIRPETYAVPDPMLVAQWRSRIGKPFFLFVGSLRYYKGLETLLEAARAFSHKVVIAGSGKEKNQIRQLIASYGLKNVELVGAISDADKMALHQLSTGFVFPSNLRSEAFGLSLLEAAMMGKPMISCEIGTATSVINQDGETGFVVPPFDAPALAQAINTLAGNTELATKMGAAAQKRFYANFTADRMADKYYDLYQAVLSRHAKPVTPNPTVLASSVKHEY